MLLRQLLDRRKHKMFKILKNAIDDITKHHDLCIGIKLEKYFININFINGVYKMDVFSYYNSNNLLIFLLKQKIKEVLIYGSIGIVYINKTVFQELDIPVNKIRSSWNRHRLRGARIRNDLVIHGLVEYWFHPSRLSF